MAIIGVTCDFETIIDSRGKPAPRYWIGACYVEAIERSGGVPVALTYTQEDHIQRYLKTIDALVISGGDFDHPPAYYGQQEREGLGKLMPERSRFEAAILDGALKEELPVLGICGGMQLLNIHFGGTLHQDVAERPGTASHTQPHDRSMPHHSVEVHGGTHLERLCGGPELPVNSTHHQLVDKVGDGLIVSGRAPDGVVEAIEALNAPFVVGVQWHPEKLAHPEQRGLYRGLVEAAVSRRSRLGCQTSQTH